MFEEEQIIKENLEFVGFIQAVDKEGAANKAAIIWGPTVYVVDEMKPPAKTWGAWDKDSHFIGFVEAATKKEALPLVAQIYKVEGAFVDETDLGVSLYAIFRVKGLVAAGVFKPITYKVVAGLNWQEIGISFTQLKRELRLQMVGDLPAVFNIWREVVDAAGNVRNVMVMERWETVPYQQQLAAAGLTEAEISELHTEHRITVVEAVVTPVVAVVTPTAELPGAPAEAVRSRLLPRVDSFDADGKTWFSVMMGTPMLAAADITGMAALGNVYVTAVKDATKALWFHWFYKGAAGVQFTTATPVQTAYQESFVVPRIGSRVRIIRDVAQEQGWALDRRDGTIVGFAGSGPMYTFMFRNDTGANLNVAWFQIESLLVY